MTPLNNEDENTWWFLPRCCWLYSSQPSYCGCTVGLKVHHSFAQHSSTKAISAFHQLMWITSVLYSSWCYKRSASLDPARLHFCFHSSHQLSVVTGRWISNVFKNSCQSGNLKCLRGHQSVRKLATLSGWQSSPGLVRFTVFGCTNYNPASPKSVWNEYGFYTVVSNAFALYGK